MKKVYVVMSFLLTAFAVQTGLAQTASVQIIHNSGDPGARQVDVYVDGALAINDFTYRTATEFLELSTTAAIAVAPGDSDDPDDGNGIADAFFNVSLDGLVVENGTYIAMATGVGNPDDFNSTVNGDIAFTLALAEAQLTGTGGNVDFITYHGATDAPAVDVLSGGFPVLSGLTYGSFTDGYTSLPAAAYTLDVVPAGTTDIVATFTADLSGLGGGAAVVFASGFLDPVPNQGGASFTLLAALTDGTVVEFPQVITDLTVVQDGGANDIEGNTFWTKNNIYLLDGIVYVEEGDTLNIEAGTVIKAAPGQGAQSSALVVARGGYINATGTAAEPIIFTSIADDTDNANDIPVGTRGLWGGVIILGNASTNTVPVEQPIEGIPVGEARAFYGGNDDDDNSGVFRYVSIRHAGTEIGAGNEINGLTMGGVGRGTTIEYVEVYANQDDGFEWFGGTVNTKYLASVLCGDDAMDYDQGWRGVNQFWFVMQAADAGDRGGEHDGGTDPETGEPFAIPVVLNATFIGSGADNPANNRTITFRDNAGGNYWNSIFTEFGRGIDIENLASGEDSYSRFQAGDLTLQNNIFWNVADNVADDIFTTAGSGADAASDQAVADYFATAMNEATNPSIQGISRTNDGGLDPRGSSDAVFSGLAPNPAPGTLMTVGYKGAFGPAADDVWINGWTAMAEYGFLPASLEDIAVATANVQIIHNSGDPAARLVDIYVNGELALDNFEYRTATSFIELPVNAVVGVAPFTSNDPDEDGMGAADIIATFPFELAAGENYVVVANGVLSPDDFAANPDGTSTAFTLSAFEGALTEPAGAEGVNALIHHGVTDAPTVEGVVDFGGGIGEIEVFPNPVAYNSFSSVYGFFGSQPFEVQIRPAGTATTVATFDVDLTGLNDAAVLVASGFLSPVANQGGASFALLGVLPDGTVVDFPEIREEIVVTDGGANDIEGRTEWTNNNTYILDGIVYVEEGDTLVIEAGTVIKAFAGQGAQSSALVVARGGYIIADGNKAEPIIFTSIADDTDNPSDIPVGTRGLWGGVIILGNASTNTVPVEQPIEGIPVGEPRAFYGGNNDDDNSGIFRYVSIRHAGTEIGAGNEINGLTMGGVGRGTTIEFVEVYANQDDGFEWFGGTVNTKYLASVLCGDDAMDYDQGWRGVNQFWFVLQAEDAGDRGGEHDGGTDPETGEPFAIPVVLNATYIGAGGEAASNNRTITFRDNAGGNYWNSIFTEFGRGIDIENLASGEDSYSRFQAGDLTLQNNIFWNVADNDAASVFTTAGSGSDAASDQAVADYFGTAMNTVANPQIQSISYTNDNQLDPRAGAAFSGLAANPAPDALMTVGFKGAFGPKADDLWIMDWTALAEYGFLPETLEDVAVPTANVQIIHNSGDPAARLVDIYVDGVLALNDFEYRTATEFIALPINAIVGVAPADSDDPDDGNGADDIIASFPFSLEADANYVVMAHGVLSPADFNTSANAEIGFTLTALADAKTVGDEAGFVDVALFHGATDAPAVDVLQTGFALVEGAPYGVFFGDGYTPLPASAYVLDITPAGDNSNIVATFDVDASGLSGQAVILVASGFLDPVSNQGGATFALLGVLPDGTVVEFPRSFGELIVVNDGGENDIEGRTTWTANNEYLLDGIVYVEEGDTLVIEAGTVIKARAGQGAQSSALVVARGGYIIADGNASQPIVFTSIADDINSNTDIPVGTRGLWGGVIILGNASTNTVPVEQPIEGIPVGEPRAFYGGNNDDDNSGIFRYVSIRHAGTEIGAGNEINGLTMGGVGRGTTIEFVEVYANQDDGFEWFGGTVNTKYLASVLCGDDAMDYDQGWRGVNQYWFILQAEDAGDRGGEHDGGTDPETGEPFAIPVVLNATFIGSGADNPANNRTITFRDNAGGNYWNSVFTEFGRGIDIENLASGGDSYQQFVDGNLTLQNNIFWNVADNDAANVFTTAGSGSDAASNQAVADYFGTANNEVINPSLNSISRTNDNQLDPRPTTSVSFENLADVSALNIEFLDNAMFKGAFDNTAEGLWLQGWTALDVYGFLPTTIEDITVGLDDLEATAELSVFPNPNNGQFAVRASDLGNTRVELVLYNLAGQTVYSKSVLPVAGQINETVNVSGLANAIYVLRVQQGDKVAVRRISVE